MKYAVGMIAVLLGLAACSTPTPGTISDAAHTAAPTPSNGPVTATWGKRFTWPDGLAVEVSQPRSCTPSQYAQPTGVKRGAVVTITVINGTQRVFDVGMLSAGADAQFAGKPTE